MKLFYCPTCTRVYYLKEDASYICGRNHVTAIWSDGKRRRFVISERSETNRPPWQIPALSEEKEMYREDLVENWIEPCKHPEDPDFTDMGRHFGYGTFGGRHLTTSEVVEKYSPYVLIQAEP
jgi:hypothetical protein